MALFDIKERTDPGPKRYMESDYDYLDRSGRPEASQVRQFIDDWLSQMPGKDAEDISNRIKGGDRRNSDSAIFELVLFAILTSLGCALEMHPELDSEVGRRPDFLVTTPDGDEFYLEAVLASDYSAAEVSAGKRKNVVLDAIDSIDSPNFFLGINASGNPDTPPRSSVLTREVTDWLEGLDPDVVYEEFNEKGYEAIPKLSWNHDDWEITFEAIPIKPDKRGSAKRVIGYLSGGVRFVNVWEPIRKAVMSKGNRYGKLDKPLLIAVNVEAFSLDPIDEMQALFGQEELVVKGYAAEAEPEMQRIPNGAWIGRGGPHYTRVSGAWLFDNLNSWNIVSRRNTLYLNPWASKKLPEFVQQVNHARAIDGVMKWTDGASIHEILRLSETWPE